MVYSPAMSSTAPLACTAAPAAARRPPKCRHCGGSGREPAALRIEFSRSGELRGEQSRLAEALGISPAMLSYIIAGERVPGVATLVKMARHFRTTVDRVLRIPAIWRAVNAENAATESATEPTQNHPQDLPRASALADPAG